MGGLCEQSLNQPFAQAFRPSIQGSLDLIEPRQQELGDRFSASSIKGPPERISADNFASSR
jgi:hypothetical protein